MLKFRLKLNALSFPLATSTTGTVTGSPDMFVAFTTRTDAGGVVTVRVALLLVAEPREFVTTAE